MSSVLEFKKITKCFPGVLALDHICFTAKGGEVTALVGENGAGKSTLLKILNGDYQADEGQYLIDGKECHFYTPQDAITAGVSIIYQERQLVPFLSVAENLYMEDIPLGKCGLIDYQKLNKMAQAIVDEFKLPIKATDRIQNLSVAYQQMVEIMKSYRRDPKIIAFDEPSASLSDTELATLFEIIGKLKKKGIIILYVSHRMKEIFQITSQVVIMKDGKFVEQIPTESTNEKEIVRKMVGRDLGDIFKNLNRNTEIGNVVLEAHHLVADNVKDVSFQLNAGEILGFAGLVGAGRTETMLQIFGAKKRKSGQILIDGKKVHISQPEHAIGLGLGLCPEDRKDEGIVAKRSITNNISLAIIPSLKKHIFFDFQREKEVAIQGVKELNIKTTSIEKPIGELSGGNQQKVILSRWLAAHPRVLILDEPTKGIDVGSKSEIYQIICNLAKQGIGIIVISSELPEVIGVCDRIIVMCQGRITGELFREEATEEKILTMAMADMLERIEIHE